MFGLNRFQHMKHLCHQITGNGFRNYYLLILLIIYTSLPSIAQLPDSINVFRENPEKRLRNLRIQNVTNGGFNFWNDDFSGHWAGIDLGFNALTTNHLSGDIPYFLEYDFLLSNSLFVNIIQQSIGFQKTRNTIGLVTGLGVQFKSYRLDKNNTIEKRPSGSIEAKTLVFDINQKSKFSAVYLNVPLLLEFQIPLNHYANRIFVSGGVVGGYRLSSHTKIKYKVDRNKEKLKMPGDYSLQDFKYGLMMRMGYRQFQIFMNYDLIPMFKEQAQVPDIYPLTVGITLLSF
jgi:hypothetical protein